MIKARWICRVRLITVVKAAEKSRLVTSERYLSQCAVTSVLRQKRVCGRHWNQLRNACTSACVLSA